jgi:hypothetical protein
MCATGALAASLCLSLSAAPAWAQAAPGFDPAHPFAGVTAPEQWAKRFATGKPTFDRHDPWAGFTARDWNNQGFYGDHAGHPDETPLSVIGKKGPDRQINQASIPSGGKGIIIRSPYPYKTAQEHFDAWKAAAGGGTLSTQAKALPDWSGDWQGDIYGFLSRGAKISDTMAALTPEYQQHYADILYAQWQGHTWEPLEFCLPRSFGVDYGDGTWHFMVDRHMVLLNESSFNSGSRYIYTDGRGFLPEDKAQHTWFGESVGFWDGDELVIHTKNIRGWMFGTTLPEYSDEMQTVERWKRIGDQMLVDITFYDPKAFAFPWHDVAIFHVAKDWTAEPATLRNCVDTNNVYMDAKGDIVSHQPGEVGYMNMTLNPRPWASAAELWKKSYPKQAAEWEASLKRDLDKAKAGQGYAPQ